MAVKMEKLDSSSHLIMLTQALVEGWRTAVLEKSRPRVCLSVLYTQTPHLRNINSLPLCKSSLKTHLLLRQCHVSTLVGTLVFFWPLPLCQFLVFLARWRQ